MIHIECSKCKGIFGVEDVVGKRGKVFIDFCCPYCHHEYSVGEQVVIAGVSGGVNIGGDGNISVGGDIAGRDIVR